MDALAGIVNSQIAWAKGRGLSPDAQAYLPTFGENLFAPLSELTEKDFRGSAGGELDDRPDEPAKMRALYSSSALVCNVFDYWRNVNPAAIGRALAIETAVTDVRFEARLPSGLRGTPPTLDLLLSATDTLAFGIESKFTEPYQGRRKREPFVDTYFRGVGLWASLGLPKCQDIAERLSRGQIEFGYLDVAQLLKHTLGIRRRFRDGRLILLWFNPKTLEAEALSTEIRLFCESVDPTLGFRAVTYQEVFGRLEQEPLVDLRYLSYLSSRYFSPDASG